MRLRVGRVWSRTGWTYHIPPTPPLRNRLTPNGSRFAVAMAGSDFESVLVVIGGVCVFFDKQETEREAIKIVK